MQRRHLYTYSKKIHNTLLYVLKKEQDQKNIIRGQEKTEKIELHIDMVYEMRILNFDINSLRAGG